MCVPNNKIMCDSKLKYAFFFSVSQTITMAIMYTLITICHFPYMTVEFATYHYSLCCTHLINSTI